MSVTPPCAVVDSKSRRRGLRPAYRWESPERAVVPENAKLASRGASPRRTRRSPRGTSQAARGHARRRALPLSSNTSPARDTWTRPPKYAAVRERLQHGQPRGLREQRAESARRRADDADRPAAEHARNVGVRPRQPVDRVLEHAGQRVVVLGRDEQQAVGRDDALLELHDGVGQPFRSLDDRRRRAGCL